MPHRSVNSPSPLAVTVAFLLCLSGSCASEGRATPPSDGIDRDAGRRLHEGRCATCHGLYPASSRTAAQWEQALDSMSGKARLTRSEHAVLLSWLRLSASDARRAADE